MTSSSFPARSELEMRSFSLYKLASQIDDRDRHFVNKNYNFDSYFNKAWLFIWRKKKHKESCLPSHSVSGGIERSLENQKSERVHVENANKTISWHFIWGDDNMQIKKTIKMKIKTIEFEENGIHFRLVTEKWIY